jgi:hypothetical protein
MGALHHANSVQSVEQLDQASFGLQLAAFGYGAGLLLATNLVVTGWTVAIQGGRLDVSRRAKMSPPKKAPQRARRRAQLAGTTGLDLRQNLAAVALFACAAIHIAVIPDHLNHWVVASAFFLALALAEVAGGVLLLREPGQNVLIGVAAASVIPPALWLWSRTSGLPFGPNAGVPEPVGLADLAAGVLELGALAISVVLLRASRRETAKPEGPTTASAHLRALAVAGIIAIGSLGVAGGIPGWLGDVDTSGNTTHTIPH